MKKNLFLSYRFLFILSMLAFLVACSHTTQKQATANVDFEFVFMTDIHLMPQSGGVEGFTQAIEKINEINPAFALTGGDLIIDGLEQNEDKVRHLFDLYIKTVAKCKMPVYNTIGNHDILGWYENSGVPENNPVYGKKLYTSLIGKTFHSFDFKGWRFYCFDSVEQAGDTSYVGRIDSMQMAWIKHDLAKLDRRTPIVLSTHIPFITTLTQLWHGSTVANPNSLVVCNSKEVLDLFHGYNLKLVLQGHLHFFEDLHVSGVHYVTGGSIAGAWWTGDFHGTKEGFVRIKAMKDQTLDIQYVDYGWDATKYQINDK